MGRLASPRFNSLIRYAPVWVHLFVYVLSYPLAVAFLYFDYRPVVALIEYFSGTVAPKDYTFHQAAAFWALILGAPLLFTIGFLLATRIQRNTSYASLQKFSIPNRQNFPIWMPVLLFLAALSLGAYNLMSDGFISKLNAWSDYRSWVDMRWEIFSKIGFFEFVNIYTILPMSAAWVILNIKGNRWSSWAARCTIVMVICIMNLLLFQKKALIVSLLLIFLAIFFYHTYSITWRIKHTAALILIFFMAAVTYFLMVVMPVYSESSRTAVEILTKEEAMLKDEKTDTLLGEIGNLVGEDRSIHVFAYAILAPMTRSTLPAMYYPIVFPDRHPYYGLDWGQDIIGLGSMPDDNFVIWNNMYKNQPGGSAYGGYQFAFYSQVGLFWALLLCVALGFVLGILWHMLLVAPIDLIFRAMACSIFIVFSIHIVIDSFRNSLVSSYGFIWPLLFISFFSAASWFLEGRVGKK